MNLNKYLPVENYILETDLSPEEITKRLTEKTTHQKSWYDWRAMKGGKPYYGVIQENVFTINRVIGYRNSFLPLIKGEVSRLSGRTQVHIRMRLSRFVQIFMFFWLGCTALVGGFIVLAAISGIANYKKGYSFFALVPFAMLFFGFFMMSFAFKKESKISRKFLTDLLNGVERQAG